MGDFQVDNTIVEQEKAILVGLVTDLQTEEQVNEYLAELAFLCETAGAVPIKSIYQKRSQPHPRTYVGQGKLTEIKEYVKAKDIDLVIFDDEISPSQQRNIEKELKCKVLDRSMLILDIFAQRAKTVQAKTQVELAQTQYLLPRLRGMWTHLDRVKGGIGMRGAGEKEIETDRRIAQKKISNLKAQLDKIAQQNKVQRSQRGELIRVALVGYTNVGKSTIMRLLSKSDVLAENKLFATLDTTVRKVVLDRMPLLLSDTVGFIRKLPHHLVESFKSTLEETVESDLLLHVVDISHPQYEDQMKTVEKTLKEIGCGDHPTITVFNKMDQYRDRNFDELLPQDVRDELLQSLMDNWQEKTNNQAVFISAIQKENVDVLRARVHEQVENLYRIRYPYKTHFF